MAREELGLDPDQLGNPWTAAISSFLAFGFGALIPLLPNLFTTDLLALILTVALSGAAVFGIGALLGTLTGKNLFWGGGRMLFVGAAAAGVTYGIGSLVGISLET